MHIASQGSANDPHLPQLQRRKKLTKKWRYAARSVGRRPQRRILQQGAEFFISSSARTDHFQS
jgi:hypothetical protein